MSDQDPQAPVVDTPDAAIEQHNDEQTIDWEQRHREAQAWGTRASQENAEYRRQLDALRNGDREAFAALGLELADQEEDEDPVQDYGETDAQYEARIAALEQRFEQQTQDARFTQIETHVEKQLDALPDVDEATRDLVVKLAVQMDPAENGMPDIQGAYAALEARDLARQKAWAEGKKSAPRVSPVGQAGTQNPAISEMTPEQRAEFMAQRLHDIDG